MVLDAMIPAASNRETTRAYFTAVLLGLGRRGLLGLTEARRQTSGGYRNLVMECRARLCKNGTRRHFARGLTAEP
jgi:hypothetical protein